MYYQRRSKGYTFVYFDTTLKKNVRLKKKHYPTIHTEEQAKAFCEEWDAKYDAMKLRRRKRMEWTEKYKKFHEALEKYIISRREDAPYSWDNDVYNLRYYVFPFFIDIKDQNNVNTWHYFFEEFRYHLESVPPVKRKTGANRLAYNSMNTIIRALNSFITVMYRRREIENNNKCRLFPEHKCRTRNETSVIDPIDQDWIERSMKELNWTAAEMFRVGLHTGMRPNELLGLSAADFFSHDKLPPPLETALKPYGFKVYGFITIDSQPLNSRGKLRNPNGEVPRKPLKSKKSIEKELKTIPIFDKETYNILVYLFNQQQKEFERSRYGNNPKDYLLFNLDKNSFSHFLRQAQKRMKKVKCFTPHDMRHTYCTWLNEQTGENMGLAKMILGHTKVEMTQKYSHVNQRLKKHLETKKQLLSPMQYIQTPKIPETPLNQLYQKYQKTEPRLLKKTIDFRKVAGN